MDGGACWATIHGVTKSGKRLSNFTFFLKDLVIFSSQRGAALQWEQALYNCHHRVGSSHL